MVLLSARLKTSEIERRLRAADLPARETEGLGGDTVTVDTDDGTLFVTAVPRALTGEDVMNNIHPLFTEEDEIPALGNHAAHLVVVAVNFEAEGTRKVRRHLHQLHARALKALSGLEEVVGYAIDGTTFGPAALRRELADEHSAPIDLWAPAWVWSGDHGITAYTYGLAAFGHPEVQLVDADVEVAEAYVVLSDVAAYVIKGVDLEEGASVGWRAEMQVGVEKRPWVVDLEQPAWQLRMH
ncbi:DUF4261 domain-containing protein [Corynebacterium yudongzhengii]|nr:DUF4261 domain-containing protein [Corynebacterium yudongzhengii]